MDWTRAIVKLRVPEQIPDDAPIQLKTITIENGWLGKLKFNSDLNNPHPEGPDAANICAYADGKAAAEAYWLPNESLAKAWKQYCLRKDVSFHNGATEIALANDSFVNSTGMRMIAIPTGRFIMGSPLDEEKRADDEVQHEVHITKPFYMGATEVTQAQWQKVMGNNPATYKADTNPVEIVSYDDAVKFCEVLSKLDGRTYRLPTEAEWEYACRAGTTTPFHYGWSIDTDIANYRGDVGYGGDARHRPTTPGPSSQFPPNNWGLHDMHGNVFEWCSDWYGPYPTESVTDPKGPASGTQRVFRGGSWYNLPHITRSAFRGMSSPGYTSRLVGLRVVCDGPDKQPKHCTRKDNFELFYSENNNNNGEIKMKNKTRTNVTATLPLKLVLTILLLAPFALRAADTKPPFQSKLTSGVTFQSKDAGLQRLYDAAEAGLAKNATSFSGMKVITEGAGYPGAYLESAPEGGEIYANRDTQIALNHQALFMLGQRPDGRMPVAVFSGQWEHKQGFYRLTPEGQMWLPAFGLLVTYNSLAHDYDFPNTAWKTYFWSGRNREYLERLYNALEMFDNYIWRTRDSNNDGLLEVWCTYDTGEDGRHALHFAPALPLDGRLISRPVCPARPTRKVLIVTSATGLKWRMKNFRLQAAPRYGYHSPQWM